jgi:uncharacterized protein (TIGR03067 family)
MNHAILALGLIFADGGETSGAYTLATDDLAQLQRGEWDVIHFWVKGKDIAETLPEHECRILFRRQLMILGFEGGDRNQFTLNPNAIPKQLDWGGGARLGIYRLRNGILEIAYSNDGPRPRDFSGSDIILLVLVPARPVERKGNNP